MENVLGLILKSKLNISMWRLKFNKIIIYWMRLKNLQMNKA